MLAKIFYFLSINLLPIITYISLNLSNLKKLYDKRDFLFFLYIIFFIIFHTIFYKKEQLFLIIFILYFIIVFLWIILFEVYYKKTKNIRDNFVSKLNDSVLTKNVLKEKVDHLSQELELYKKQLNKYFYLFSLVQEINENLELNKITKEFYMKIISHFGQDRIYYFGLFIYRKKDIINVLEYPAHNEGIISFFKDSLIKNINFFELQNFIFNKIYSNKYEYMIIIECNKLNDELFSELNFFIRETKIGFVRAILFNEVEELTRIDGLTQLYLRRYFLNRLNDELLRAQRYNTEFSLIMIDIDFFKKINDQYGHLTGDFILKNVASIIKDIVSDQGLCCRWGGEEFLIFIPYQSKKEVENFAEKLRKEIENTNFKYEDKVLNITVSCGISFFPLEAKDIKTLIEIADFKLYKSKQTGRNKVTS